MTNTEHTPDQASRDFIAGREDGYMGAPKARTSGAYLDGYAQGVQDYNADVEAADAYDYGSDYAGWDNPVEQGMYDDDPNPYHGTY